MISPSTIIIRFKRAVENMDRMRKGEVDSQDAGRFKAFVEEFDLLDPSTFDTLVLGPGDSTSSG